MPDKMEDMKLPTAQLFLQRRQSGALLVFQRQARQLQQTLRFQRCDCGVDFPPLRLDIERLIILWAGDHHQHLERQRHRQWLGALRQVEIAHDRCDRRMHQEALPRRIIEIFPRQFHQGRRQPQPQPDALFALFGIIDAAQQTCVQVALKDGFIQPAAKLARLVHLRRVDAAHSLAWTPSAQKEVFNLQGGKRQIENRLRLSGR